MKFKKEKLTEYLNKQFLQNQWKVRIHPFSHDSKKFGALIINESVNKPVICTQNGNKIKGEIYYRYSGGRKNQTNELLAILDEVKQNERRKWMEHIQDSSNWSTKYRIS